jgi:hypothetical protein
LLELETIRRELAERGTYYAKDEDVMCRYKYQDILIDVMSTEEVGWRLQIPGSNPDLNCMNL